jgi:diguanylate cyclase (GGDEF)-like protein
MFEILLQFQISIFSIFALVALLISIYYKEEIYNYSNRLFRAIIYHMILLLFLEMMAWAFDGIDNQLSYLLNYGFNFLLYLLGPTVAAFWATYIDYKIHHDVARIKRRIMYLHGFIIGAVLIVINFFTPILFSISSDNVYSRGPLTLTNLVFIYGLLIYTIGMVFKNRKSVNDSLLLIVSTFLIIPAIASIIQLLNYGLIIMLPSLAIAVIVAYLFLETQSSSKDYLTGLYNRSRLDDYVERLIEKNVNFSVVMIDLDDYKKINDTYGHGVGDKIIIIFGNLLKSVFGEKALVSRYGGDEFIIVCLDSNEEVLELEKQNIIARLSQYDDELVKETKFSMGFSSRTNNNQKSFEQLLTEADDLMYQDKAYNKNFKRRKSDR